MWSYLRDRICLSDAQIRLFWGYCLALLPFVQSCPRFVAAVGYTYHWKLYIRLSLNKIKSEILTFPHHLHSLLSSLLMRMKFVNLKFTCTHTRCHLLWVSFTGKSYMWLLLAVAVAFSAPHQDMHSGKFEENVLIGLGWVSDSHFGDVTPVLYFSTIKRILFFKSSRLIILEKEELVAKLRAYHRWNCYLTFTYSYVDN